MKVNLYDAGGTLDGGFTMPGMTLTGPLLLSGNVSSPLEAVHKQYVDTAATNLDAANIVSGTIATARLPGLTGDVTSSNNSNNVVLNLSGVIAGDYTKVTVDAKGRVTVGLSLTEADLPNISWSKISTGKPTTMTGYGITDGVSTVNGVISGNLTLGGAPTLAVHAATKAYADANSAGGSKIVAGDIVSQVTNVTPSGFLRCNGGVLDKTAYSALYSVIGDAFTGGNTQPGAGRPWTQQYQINLSDSTTNITSWNTETAPTAVRSGQIAVTKSRVYLIGGYSAGASSTVYTAPINSDGTIGNWTTATALPAAIYYHSVLVTKNRIHVIGGFNSTNKATVYTAPINADGTLGTWVAGGNLPAGLSQSQVIITNGRVYMLGGASTNAVYTAPINTDGTLGTWTTGTSLPVAIWNTCVVVTKNRVYLVGGIIGGSDSAAIYTAPINADGTLGTWALDGGTLPSGISSGTAVVIKSRVFLVTNQIAGTASVASYSAPINADGTLGTWTQGTSMPLTLTMSHVFTTSTKLYVIGGYRTGEVSTSYSANLVGGLNDYSAYYDGTITVVNSNSFRIPDYSLYEKTSLYFYMKS